MQGLVEEVLRLKRERDAVILAHNYQRPEVQAVADFLGDSLDLSLEAARTNAKIIVFAGVYFMAEVAAVLNPDKLVLIPDTRAGCTLVDSVRAEDIIRWRRDHPNGVVVTYINSSIEVKAVSDYVCTSANCHKIVESIPRDRPVLFVPDKNLGNYIRYVTGRDNLYVWNGSCYVHDKITYEVLARTAMENRGFILLVHPECSGTVDILRNAEKLGVKVRVASTQGMVKAVKASGGGSFVIATETGIINRILREVPNAKVVPALEDAVCEFMKLITLDKIHRSLRDFVYPVRVPEDLAKRARVSIMRMLEFR
ncbi:quinolinate synthase [Vulcanisaeta sp. EB80]|uniref:quinolinate synthase NadA n=1 Tax=Vulcanisaeta sp. EB80 TaxID=1650660 RepID=UPI0009BFCC93|nr:quinolinate synthase NadA [Vulcanisaeta sp. EB80]PLC68281.1 quinolinate synthase [Vulcanisaeta sp. EB80]